MESRGLQNNKGTKRKFLNQDRGDWKGNGSYEALRDPKIGIKDNVV